MALHPIRSATPASAPSRLSSPNMDRAADISGRVKDSPRGNYMLAHPPGEWMLKEDGSLVPVLVPVSKSPGVQAVGRRGEFGAARAYYEGRGYTLIPHNVIPTDYVALYLNERSQKVHRSIFQSPISGPDGTTIWSFDEESWDKFVRLLRAKGYITAPRPHIVRGILVAKTRQYENLRPPNTEDRSRRDAYEKLCSMLLRQIASLEKELETSVSMYGEAVSEASGDIGSMLDAALSEMEPEAPEPAPKPSTKKPSSSK